MTSVLNYAELESNRANSLLSTEGELFVSLPPKHAKALVSFIEITRIAQSWNAKQTPFLKRLPSLAKGLWVAAIILFRHPRLFELGRVVVLNSRSQIWHHQPTGDVLFTFQA